MLRYQGLVTDDRRRFCQSADKPVAHTSSRAVTGQESPPPPVSFTLHPHSRSERERNELIRRLSLHLS